MQAAAVQAPGAPAHASGQQVATWHSKEDTPQRKLLIQHIFRLFTQRKPNVSQEWQDRLPDFVKRLEEALYRNAASKAEYEDVSTLEHRLQQVARSFVSNKSNRQQAQAQSLSNLALPQQQPSAGASSLLQQQQMLGLQQRGVSGLQNGLHPGIASGLMQGSSLPYQIASGSLGANGMPGVRLPGPGMPGASQPLLSSPALGQSVPDSSMGLMGMSPLQQQATALRSQAGSPAAVGPLMANGKPAVLRGSAARDQGQQWPPGGMAVPTSQGHAGRVMMNGHALSPQLLGTGAAGPGMSSAQPAALMGQPNMSQSMRMPSGSLPAGMMNGMMPGVGMLGLSGSSSTHSLGSMMPIMGQPHVNGLTGASPVIQAAAASGSVVPHMPHMPSNGLPGHVGPQGQYNLQVPGGSSSMGSSMSSEEVAMRQKAKKDYIVKQQRWLLFLRHCAKCQSPDGQCSYGSSCAVAKQLWTHILTCNDQQCEYPRCVASRELLKHHQKCTSETCLICVPVKQHVQAQRMAVQYAQEQQQQAHKQQQAVAQQAQAQHQQHQHQQQQQPGQPQQQATVATQQQVLAHFARQRQMLAAQGATPQQQQALMVVQQQRIMQQGLNPQLLLMQQPGQVLHMNGMAPQQQQQQQQQQLGSMQQPGAQAAVSSSSGQRRAGAPLSGAAAKRPKVEAEGNQGTSLLEAFTADEIQTHLDMLRSRPAGQLVQIMSGDDNQCRACGDRKLTFEPPSLYCTGCGQRIKRNQVYYTSPTSASTELKGYWCHSCFQDTRGDAIDMDGTRVRKSDLKKGKNDDEQEEGWVACDSCGSWVHMICGLFNKGRNNDNMPYHCPECLLSALLSGKRQKLSVRPQAMLEAKDLPTCELSNFLQQRIDKAVAAEHLLRAKQLGVDPRLMPANQVCGGLTLRVINNITKRMEVKPRYAETFKGDNYPEAFPYRQKVILLFQRMDGVDVCLYCLYMQEYGEDSPAPNRRWVYLSYLDSVKYFRPEREAAGRINTALRSMVYHELMVGYLDYIKRRGFTSMFIWACPPLQGDDYILYCHPHKQKTPRSDRLREWYHALLRQAKQEGIVTHISNLYDTFCEGGRDHRVDAVSSRHLPYFEGDYWPGEAEVVLANFEEQQRQAGRKGNKAALAAGKARGKQNAKGKRYAAGSADEQLMGKLGEVIQGMKDDFIVVHLQEPCSHCREYVSGDVRWFHPSPPMRSHRRDERQFEGISLDNPGQSANRPLLIDRFQLCQTCFAQEKGGGAKAKGLPAGIRLEDLQAIKQDIIPSTADRNPDVDCQFFHTRQAFLSLCQGNHYQFDTIRRAKHSSAMVLYHLHNPDAPAFASTCNKCNAEIEPGQGFRCSVCTDFDLCRSCYSSGQVKHEHPLVAQARRIDETRMRLSDSERHDRAQQLQRTMYLLVHASACNNPNCSSSNCSKVKGLFQHAVQCQKKISGGCHLCRRMWALLQLHAKQCTASDCPVPRCRELREMRKRQMARKEEQRRRAYQAMLQHQNQAASAQDSSSQPATGGTGY